MNKLTKPIKKVLIIILISIFAIGLIIGTVLLLKVYKYMEFIIPVSQNRIEKEFLRNEDTLDEVAEYLKSLEYCRIYITSTSEEGSMYASKDIVQMGEELQIEDDIMAKKIYDLLDKDGFNVILKKDNYIYFQRWANLDYGRGILYSMDGKEPTSELITILEPIPKENWYYYEGN